MYDDFTAIACPFSFLCFSFKVDCRIRDEIVCDKEADQINAIADAVAVRGTEIRAVFNITSQK